MSTIVRHVKTASYAAPPETTFRQETHGKLEKTRPPPCGGRQSPTLGLLWEQMWTSKTGPPEATEENFAPSTPPAHAPLWSTSVKTAARLWPSLSNYCRIPSNPGAAAAAPCQNRQIRLKSRQNPDRSRAPTLPPPAPYSLFTRVLFTRLRPFGTAHTTTMSAQFPQICGLFSQSHLQLRRYSPFSTGTRRRSTIWNRRRSPL